MGSHHRVYPAPQVKGYQPVMREHPWSLHLLSAMTAGATSTICTNPLWVIKTRFMVSALFTLRCIFPHGLQTQLPGDVPYRHTLDAALTIYRSEGIGAFYRGLLPSLLGILHVAVQFPLYEKLKIVARASYSYPDLSHLLTDPLRRRLGKASIERCHPHVLGHLQDDCLNRNLPSRSHTNSTPDATPAAR